VSYDACLDISLGAKGPFDLFAASSMSNRVNFDEAG